MWLMILNKHWAEKNGSFPVAHGQSDTQNILQPIILCPWGEMEEWKIFWSSGLFTNWQESSSLPRRQPAWVQIPPLPLPSLTTLGKSLPLSMSQFPLLCKNETHSTHTSKGLPGWNKLIPVKWHCAQHTGCALSYSEINEKKRNKTKTPKWVSSARTDQLESAPEGGYRPQASG